MKWLSTRDLQAEGVRLFCLPHAGSGAAGFYRWKRLLPPSIAVCPVLLPGREARFAEPPLTDVVSIVEALHAEAHKCLDKPYALFGHSMGSLLAYEWARRIAAEGLPKPVCLFASGRNAPQRATGHVGLHRLEPEAFLAELKRRYGGEPEVLLAEPELREVFLPILRSDLRVVETYRFTPKPSLACEIRALAGNNDASVAAEGLAGWAEVTTGGFGSRRFAGDHFYHFGDGQAELLGFIAAVLSSAAPSASRAEG